MAAVLRRGSPRERATERERASARTPTTALRVCTYIPTYETVPRHEYSRSSAILYTEVEDGKKRSSSSTPRDTLRFCVRDIYVQRADEEEREREERSEH